LYAHVTDMRKGFVGLSAIIREEFQADPTDGSLFIFINRRRDRMKLLHVKVEEDQKRLEIDSTQLAMLLAGVSLAQASKRRKRFAA